MLDLLAPIGRAIEFAASAQRILLFGQDTAMVRLIPIAHDAVARARAVVLVSTPSPEPFPIHLLSPEIEYRSEDRLNSELIAWADAIVASGSTELYRLLSDDIRATRYRLEPGFARVLVDLPMPCGTGACCACAVDTARGVKFSCVDGPAFDLAEFDNRRGR
jgi:dihydroorotate dehydrogenase electron transfer subunit